MEKRTPHYKLSTVKSLVKAGRVVATYSAVLGARSAGIFSLEGMCESVLSLSPQNFVKSMTTHADHKVWQDVYHACTGDGLVLYVKLTVIDHLLIVSFKER